MDSPAIRPVRPEDAGAINHIMRELGWFKWTETPAETEARIAGRIRAYFADAVNRTTLVAARPDGTVVGFVCAHWLYSVTATEGFITHLFVGETAHGQGIGRRLLASVVEQAQTRGCTRLMLYVRRHREVYRRGFYQDQGWQEQDDAALFMQAVK